MYSIAIDGPGGAGKSTIARRMAGVFGFQYVDTGSLYRAIGLAVLRAGLTDEAEITALLPSLDIRLTFQDGERRVLLRGEDVGACIRAPEVSAAASGCSALPAVRAYLLELQRDCARRHDVVMDGRDIGTVVLPHADVKIFLTADPADRARRRYEEYIGKGRTVAYEDILSELILRDERDAARDISPMRPAADAVTVDTTGNTLAQSIAAVEKLIREKLGL